MLVFCAFSPENPRVIGKVISNGRRQVGTKNGAIIKIEQKYMLILPTGYPLVQKLPQIQHPGYHLRSQCETNTELAPALNLTIPLFHSII